MALVILHTNDFHGTLSEPVARRLRELKGDGLYLDSGDCIHTGNLGIPLREEPAWALLEAAGCDASVLGNRETHVLESAFKAKIKGARHPLLCGNLYAKDRSRPLPSHLILERAGLRVGIVSAMVPMVTERMATRAASAFLWSQPLDSLAKQVEELRPRVDLLIALTHLGIRRDEEIVRQLPTLDVILGGHSHTVLERPVKLGDTWICQGGSHGRFAGLYTWTAEGLAGGLVPLTA